MKKEKDPASKERLESLRKELADMRDKANEMKARWQLEKEAITKVREKREQLEKLRRELEKAEDEYDLNKAAELKHGKIPALEKELFELEKQMSEQKENTLLREEVTEDEIAEIVARWTGIPVTRLVEGERQKLLRLEESLKKRVIGQDEAVNLVADSCLTCKGRY